MAPIYKSQVYSIEALLHLTELIAKKENMVSNFSNSRTRNLSELSMKEACTLTAQLIERLDIINVRYSIITYAYESGIIKDTQPLTQKDFNKINSFLQGCKWADADFLQLELQPLVVINNRFHSLLQYCKEYGTSLRDIGKYANEAVMVMYGKDATDSLLTELNLTTEPTTRKRPVKGK